jgi:hypothetical protein
MSDDIDSRSPNASTVWQLWHRDMFDRDAPLSLQTTGTDVVQGLYELWRYTLKEGILDNGNASFSRFQLTWGNTPATRADIFVNPFDNPALLKLRRWTRFMSEDQESDDLRIVPAAEEQKDALLSRLAQLHYEFLQKSIRWNASTIDWSAEAREILARVDLISDPEEL